MLNYAYETETQKNDLENINASTKKYYFYGRWPFMITSIL